MAFVFCATTTLPGTIPSLSNHCHQTKTLRTRCAVKVLIASYFPTPMDHCHIRLQKADLCLEQCERGLFEASTQQARMVFFKIGSAMKPVGTDVNEINVVGHDYCKLVSIMLRPSVA